MILIGRWAKIWILISLISLLLWAFHFFPFGYEKFFIVAIQGNQDSYVANLGLAFWTSFIGIHTLLFASVLGLAALAFDSLKKSTKWSIRLAACALVLYSSFYILELPYFQVLLGRSTVFFAYSYLLQVILAVPTMTVLGLKLWNYDGSSQKSLSVWRWVGIAFAGFTGALWANVVMRWFDMINTSGFGFLLNGIISLGFLDSALLMSAALIFAVMAAFIMAKGNRNLALKLIGASLVVIGLHYIIYTVYSYYANVLSFVLLVDVWTIPLLGVGISLLIESKKQNQDARSSQGG